RRLTSRISTSSAATTGHTSSRRRSTSTTGTSTSIRLSISAISAAPPAENDTFFGATTRPSEVTPGAASGATPGVASGASSLAFRPFQFLSQDAEVGALRRADEAEDALGARDRDRVGRGQRIAGLAVRGDEDVLAAGDDRL